MNKKYPALTDILAAPFYQCWAEFEDDPPEIILQNSISQTLPQIIEKAIFELDSILTEPPNKQKLSRVIGEEIGCSYDPSSDGLTDFEWLQYVRNALRLSQQNACKDQQ